MTFDPSRHHRRSVRLYGYDYAQEGAYFVTVCTQGKACLFGELKDGVMRLNEAGRMVESVWKGLPERFLTSALDQFVVMPNHFHGIIVIRRDHAETVGAQFIAPNLKTSRHADKGEGAMNRAPTVGEIVRAFKAVSSRIIRREIDLQFAWQRNYYEHIIRDEASLDRIRRYVLDNPGRWADDPENPEKD